MKLLPILSALGVLALSSCTAASIQPSYYALALPESTVSADQGKSRYPVQILVRRFTTTLAYDRPELVYRTNKYTLNFYSYRLWVARPSKMVTELVAARLRRGNLFQDVLLNLSERLPEYELQGEILSLEELDTTEKLWFGQMSIRFTLLRFSDKKPLWVHTFSVTKAVRERDPISVVAALSEILDDELKTLERSLNEQLAKRAGLQTVDEH